MSKLPLPWPALEMVKKASRICAALSRGVLLATVVYDGGRSGGWAVKAAATTEELVVIDELETLIDQRRAEQLC
jgi:hypothetical protein